MSVDIPPEVVGTSVAGSAMALRWVPGTSWASKIANLGSGAVFGVMTSLATNWYIGLTSVVGLSAISFFGGLFGISAADKVQEFVKSAEVAQVWKVLLDWLRKILGVKEAP